MEISQKGFELIKQFEGCSLKAYQDSVGVWTIGWGTTNADREITGKEIQKGLTISQELADHWLLTSINKKYVPKVNKYNHLYNFSQNQFDALVSFCYNIGSIDQLIGKNHRSIGEISEAILLYNKAGNKVLPGLVRRRKAEKELFDRKTQTQTQTNSSFSKNCSFFDAKLYHAMYPDLQTAYKGNYNKLRDHYYEYGISEGRVGSFVFDAEYYNKAYSDLEKVFKGNYKKLYEHYVTYGIREGRQASILFNPKFYLNNYVDLKQAFGNDYQKALNHFITDGVNEGRKGSPDFDVRFYRSLYADLDNAYGNSWKQYFIHYLVSGKREGRKCKQ